ncbi:hypothetical protein K474DRAFT_1671947 [Panus rudis PR-1116 ss-1]|nr:hypothetical protein K474DRAFT_1671947 [Panus rudis PR-1116 ss-1]
MPADRAGTAQNTISQRYRDRPWRTTWNSSLGPSDSSVPLSRRGSVAASTPGEMHVSGSQGQNMTNTHELIRRLRQEDSDRDSRDTGIALCNEHLETHEAGMYDRSRDDDSGSDDSMYSSPENFFNWTKCLPPDSQDEEGENNNDKEERPKRRIYVPNRYPLKAGSAVEKYTFYDNDFLDGVRIGDYLIDQYALADGDEKAIPFMSHRDDECIRVVMSVGVPSLQWPGYHEDFIREGVVGSMRSRGQLFHALVTFLQEWYEEMSQLIVSSRQKESTDPHWKLGPNDIRLEDIWIVHFGLHEFNRYTIELELDIDKDERPLSDSSQTKSQCA